MRLAPLLVALLAVPALALASPLRCADPCVVQASFVGYSPPVAEVGNNTTVTWRSTAGGHIQADTGTQPACFVTFVEGGGDSDPARFVVRGGALWANTTSLRDAECRNARKVDDRTFVLPYECTVHPNMRGTLLVRAD